MSYATERDDIDHAGYADAVIREATARADDNLPTIESVFFGGGTPSLWAPKELGRVLSHLKKTFRFAASSESDIEVTVECNPTSLDYDRAKGLIDAGANRLSIGTQSTRADQLNFLGRLHDPAGAAAAVNAAMEAGVPRVSTDLIFGLPNQSPEDAVEQATTLADRGMVHLSCYQLTIEPGTQFGERKKRGLLPMADDGQVAESFLAIDEALTKRGLAHYEISNYAKPGEEARHNIAYWRGDEYIGLGCGAFGFTRVPQDAREPSAETSGVRWRNAIVPKDYVERTKAGVASSITMMEEPLDAEALLRERIMLGLRMATGVDLAKAKEDLRIDPWTPDRTKEATKLIAKSRLVREGDHLRIPREAWLFTDDTASRLF